MFAAKWVGERHGFGLSGTLLDVQTLLSFSPAAPNTVYTTVVFS